MATAVTEKPAVAKKPGIFDKRDVRPGLHQLFPDPNKPGNNKFSVEIIAIPGLGADANYTWIREKVHWLRDENMLANKVSNARISVMEYASQWFGKGAVDHRVDEVAMKLLHYVRDKRGDNNKTPIIFLAHCLGGIILEEALRLSQKLQSDYPSIFPYIVGCVFLGTPFRGTKVQSKALAVAKMTEVFGLGVASELLKVLEEDSDLLMRMLNDFVRLTNEADIRVFCFYEKMKSNIVSPFTKNALVKRQEMVVDEAHATFPGVRRLDLDSDHFSLNKYNGPKDANFDLVAAQIRDIASRAPRIIRSREKAASTKLVNESQYRQLLDFLRDNMSNMDAAIKGLDRPKTLEDVEATAKATQSDVKDTANAAQANIKTSNLSWIAEDESFGKWRKSPISQLLWIHGATVQKSIAASVIDDLGKMEGGKTGEQESIVLSFFCDESDESRRSLPSMLKLLIRQIIAMDPDSAIYLLSDAKNSKKSGNQDFDKDALSKTSKLWETLQIMIQQHPGRFYIVIYGVDELSEESLQQFLGYMDDVPNKTQQSDDENNGPKIKWTLLTRLKRPNVITALAGKAHDIDFADEKNAEKVSDGLWSHISSQVDKLEIAAPLKYFLKRHIHSRAEGNGTYVSLVIQEVKNKLAMGQLQHAEIRALLESFPYGLTNIYEHIHKRVLAPKSDGLEYTKEILRCLALAQRAPTLRELAVMADLPHDDHDDLEALKRYVIQCGSFIMLRGDDYDEDSMTVEWIDSTAREHLEKYAKDALAMDLKKMQHGIIALRCLQYVYTYYDKANQTNDNHSVVDDDEEDDHEENDGNATDDEQEGGAEGENENENENDNHEEGSVKSQEDNEDEDNWNTALRYPVENWLHHAKLADTDVIVEFETSLPFWENTSATRQSWWGDVSSLHMFSDQTNVTALQVATIANYPALVEYLIKNGWKDEIHEEDSLGFQPLYAACHVGSDEIVQQLLDAGADIHYIGATAEYPVTALTGAAENGHAKIAQILLDRGADINTTSEDWGTPLYTACDYDFIEVIRLLLKNKADPNLKGGDEKRPINVAALNGNVEAVQLLLDHGAEGESDEDYWYGSAMGAASRRGHAEVVKLLLSKGYDPTKPMENYGSFLTCAATYGNTSVVELLISNETRIQVLERALVAASQNGKAEVVKLIIENKPNIRHERAFVLAATYGRDTVVELLIEKDLSQDKLNEALYVAADHERESTVKLLLRFGASPDAEGPTYGCTLTASAYDGTTRIMEALIAAGANVNKEGGDFGTPLQAAALFGNSDNVKLLLDHGAVLNTHPLGIYGYPLQAAAETQNIETVELLLASHADVNAFGGKYGYALCAAATHSETMKVLLEHGADPNVRGGEDNKPPIVIAAENLGTEDMELLLSKGADINATCDKGSTALMQCALMWDDVGLQLLISRGADIHLSSERWGTALHASAEEGYDEGCRILLDAGADPTAIGGLYGTPLAAAAKAGDDDSLKLLLEADHEDTCINLIIGEYGTALQTACAFDHEDIVQMLIDHGAIIDPQPANGKYGYPLHAAAQSGETGIVNILLEQGADVNLEGGLHGFAIIAAASGNWSNNASAIVETLLDHGADVSAIPEQGLFCSAVSAAAFANHNDVLELLISRGANVHQTGGKYGSPLICAMIKSSDSSDGTESEENKTKTCVDTLLHHGVDVNYRSDGKYHTAMIAACYFDRYDYVMKLLGHGADFRIHCQSGRYTSALAVAAIKNHSKILKALLEMHPPEQLLDEALVESVAHRQFASVKSLLQNKANVYARHPTFGTAMDALNNPQADGYNSDDELGSDDGDGKDEEEDDDEDTEWEGDGGSIKDDSDNESVADVPEEEGESEENKIRKLLEEMMQRVKRNPTMKRFNTTKRRGPPGRPNPYQQPPYGAMNQQFQSSESASNGHHYGQPPPGPPPGPPPPHLMQSYPPVPPLPSGVVQTSSVPASISPYNAYPPSQNTPPQTNSPSNLNGSGSLRRKPVPSAYPPPPTPPSQQQHSSTAQTESPPPLPQRPTSQSPSLMNPGAGGRYQQRQSSYGPPQPSQQVQQSYNRYSTPPGRHSYTPPGSQPAYNSPSQQYNAATATPPPQQQQQPHQQQQYHNSGPPTPQSNAYPPSQNPYQQYPPSSAHTQQQHAYSPPAQPHYQPFAPQHQSSQPSPQQQSYAPYSQQDPSRTSMSSQASAQTYQSSSGSTLYGSGSVGAGAAGMYSSPNSSQASSFQSQAQRPGVAGRKWTNGGYDGAGYG